MNKFIDYLKSEYQLFLGFLFVSITNLLVFLVASLSIEYYWLFIEILLLGLVVYLVARFPSYQKERTLDEQVEELKKEIKKNENSYIDKRKELEEYFLLWTHQIKTPITVSKLLFRTYENAQTKALEEQMFYIEEYTNMAMNYIKLIDRNADMDITYVDLDEIIKVVLKKYAMLFIDKKISLNYEPIHQLVIADSKWLSIMIEQLIANAVKYTNQGSITISYNNETRQLAIKDTGIGIREEDIPKIFDRGYSGFNGRLNEKSSGLGLYLVRKIALLLNIEIDVDSKLNVGSTFSLKFPANLTNL